MIVTINKRAYRMSKEEAKGLLDIASEAVPFGIYAVEKNNHMDMLKIKCDSITQLKSRIREYKAEGFKVYANKG